MRGDLNMPKMTTVLSNEGGIFTTANTEDGTGKMFIQKYQNIKPTLDYVKSHFDTPIDKSSPYRKVAEIPEVLVPKLLRLGILNDTKKLLKWLDLHENKPFRTWEGRLT